MKESNITVIVLSLSILIISGGFSIQNKLMAKTKPNNPILNVYKNYGKKVIIMSLNNFQDIKYNRFNTTLVPAPCSEGDLANLCCPYWNITILWSWTGPTYSCETGGEFKCKTAQCGPVKKII